MSSIKDDLADSAALAQSSSLLMPWLLASNPHLLPWLETYNNSLSASYLSEWTRLMPQLVGNDNDRVSVKLNSESSTEDVVTEQEDALDLRIKPVASSETKHPHCTSAGRVIFSILFTQVLFYCIAVFSCPILNLQVFFFL